MKTCWTKGLNSIEEKDLRASIASSLLMRKRFKHLMEEKVALSTSQARSKLSYDNPNWALLQADQRGYERAILEIIDLLGDL
jgi:hypothetical protein